MELVNGIHSLTSHDMDVMYSSYPLMDSSFCFDFFTNFSKS